MISRSVGRIVIRRLRRQDGGLRLRLQSALRAITVIPIGAMGGLGQAGLSALRVT